MTRILILNLTSVRLIILIVLLIVFNSCNRTNFYEDGNRSLIKIGETSYTKSEFEDIYFTIQNSSVSKDSAFKRTLRACIYNSIILNHLDSIHFELTNDDKNELDALNRNTLIKLTQDSLLRHIKISQSDVLKEMERFKEKQIVVDFIWLPVKNDKIIKECFSFLNSGGSTVDMIYSDKRFFERITELGGQIRRLNVEPGQFSFKISKFITSGKKDETKVIHEGNNHYVMKILYSKKDNFQYWSYDDVERNCKITSYLSYGPLFSNFKISDINLEILNNADFTVKALAENSKYAAEFMESKLTLKEIKDQINALPFNQKIFFNNISCVPSCVATLILLNAKKHPVNSDDLIPGLSKIGDMGILEANNQNNKSIDRCFEYQWLQSFENLTIYPWLSPFLFEDFSKLSLNYDLLYKNQLVDLKDYNLKDKIAVSANSGSLTVEEFIKELDALDKNTAAKIMNIDNARKLIYYYFDENIENYKSQSIKIDNALLENVLLRYIRNIEFENFNFGIFVITDKNTRMPFPGETKVFNSLGIAITLNNLRTLVKNYPNIIQLSMGTDQTWFNTNWRLNAFIDIIDNEIWIRKAKKLNLQNSHKYLLQVKKNTNKIKIRSFLNSRVEEINDGFIVNILKNSNHPQIWMDSNYFKGYGDYINSLNNNVVNIKSQN